jgi:WD40 repeat protein
MVVSLLALAAAVVAHAAWPEKGEPRGVSRRVPDDHPHAVNMRRDEPEPPIREEKQRRPPVRADHLPGRPAMLGAIQFRHGSGVTNVAVAPGGKTLATLGRKVRLWDLKTGKELRHFGTLTQYSSLAFSRDGKRIATVGTQQIGPGTSLAFWQIWDPVTGKEICRGRLGAWEAPSGLDFSPDRQRLATCCPRAGLQFWDARTGRELAPVVRNQGRVRAFSFSLRSNLLAAAEEDPAPRDRRGFPVGRPRTVVRLWHLGKANRPRKPPRRLWEERSAQRLLAFAPSGKTLVSVTLESGVKLWDVAAGKKLHTLVDVPPGTPKLSEEFITAAHFSPDSQILATSSGKALVLWDVGRGRQLRRLGGGQWQWLRYTWMAGRMMGGLNFAFTPDSRTLITAEAPYSTVRFWDVATGAERPKPGQRQGHLGAVLALACSPRGKTLASVAIDRTVRLWDAGTGNLRHTLSSDNQAPRLDPGVGALAFSPDGRTLASAIWDRDIHLWDVATGKALGKLQGHQHPVTALAFDPRRRHLISLACGVRHWDLDRRRQVKQCWLASAKDVPRDSAFSPAANFLVATETFRTLGELTVSIRLWDPSTGQLLHTLESTQMSENPDFVGCRPAFSPDGTSLVGWGKDGHARLWNIWTGEELHTLPRTGLGPRANLGKFDFYCFAFSPDGKTLAAAGWDGFIRLYDPATGKERRRLATAHRGAVTCLAFCPGGKRLASASTDTTVRVYDLVAPKNAARPGAVK